MAKFFAQNENEKEFFKIFESLSMTSPAVKCQDKKLEQKSINTLF